MTIEKIQSTDPKDHTQNLAKYLRELKEHCRDDIKIIDDPKAQALFETAAEVLGGLEKAFMDYQSKSERAWKDHSL